jgi:hypothetical protein
MVRNHRLIVAFYLKQPSPEDNTGKVGLKLPFFRICYISTAIDEIRNIGWYEA